MNRLSECSLKGTAEEAKSKIKCRSQSPVRTVASVITQQQHSQQDVPKVGVSSSLTITHPAPNTRKAEHRCQRSRWAANITMRIQHVSLRELDLQSGQSQHHQSDNLELPQTGFLSLCTTGRLSFLAVTTPPLMHFQLQVKFITRLWALGLRSRPEKERTLF